MWPDEKRQAHAERRTWNTSTIFIKRKQIKKVRQSWIAVASNGMISDGPNVPLCVVEKDVYLMRGILLAFDSFAKADLAFAFR